MSKRSSKTSVSSLLRNKIKKCRSAYVKSWEYNEDLRKARILKCVEGGAFASTKGINVAISSLSSHRAIFGAVKVLDNDSMGWSAIDHSLMLAFWESRFKVGIALESVARSDYTGQTLLRYTVCDFASLLCHAYASSQHDWHHTVSELWRQLAETPAAFVKGESLWEGGDQGHLFYEPFCLRLFREGTTNPTWELPETILKKELDPFQGVLDAWDDTESLAPALETALDYHCRNFTDGGVGKPWAPFKFEPFGLVPHWLLSVKKLRAEQGLDMPEVKHPLLELPTANPNGYQFGTAEDPLFAELEAFYEKAGLP
jgi:hypothetical protein